MYLRSVTMKGFKSFPEKTELAFSPGVSVIVGPNGSGKSNITDAVLWCLGEQSPGAIRGTSMQDVISVGGKNVGARSEAEVEVVIDNAEGQMGDEFTEISITRKLDRNGDGGYWMNGARCRLSDIIELLSDANLGREMHSVISQGRVDSIVHSKPRERRLLIEEAAGLGKFRKRRRRSELKLLATRDNLDRALDVEREARKALRPLKQQANSAEIGARIERQELELKSRLVAEDLRFGEARLEQARTAAEKARKVRDGLEGELTAVSRRRRAAEERFAERDRERTEIWGILNRLRSGQEKVSIESSRIAEQGRRLQLRLEDLRLELAPLTLDVGESGSASERARRLVEELSEVDAGIATAAEGLRQARAEGPEAKRLKALGDVHKGAERATTHARRAESLLGERHRERLGERMAEVEKLGDALTSLTASADQTGQAIRDRVARAERTVIGDQGDADEISAELKQCSDLEVEIQGKLRAVAEQVTGAEVEAAHLGDRKAEAAGELARISGILETEIPEPEEPLEDEEREQIEKRLVNLRTRRERLGPVNPLAKKEYEEALEHVEQLVAQREDTERAMRELEGVIRDIDAEIKRSFDETFAATAKNFEEMIAQLFPGGSGRLRSVDLRPVPQPAAEGSDAEGEEEAEEIEDEDGPRTPSESDFGVELEVTPQGKRMRQMSLLSGGEKAMTALAFVFAVFLARPCPFYILDEVEAALDDANINRFLELVRRFSDRTQFVIVTHQKLTMDAADVLYGVSMGGDGVTKVISRRLPKGVTALEGTQLEAA
ncbi:MAG TPA: AAA family ATPase [Solirubrobacterales bacterium]|nr:AAA family ATPase [Solirubrobacterales bacterium]HNA44149.1 AAA family ATPase [Solirubrobacterales bacterium]